MPQASALVYPDVHADRQPFLQARRRIVARCRRHLEARDSSRSKPRSCSDRRATRRDLHAFTTRAGGLPIARAWRSILTRRRNSRCKKLLRRRSGALRVRRVFRNRERGGAASPRFTSSKWYLGGRAL